MNEVTRFVAPVVPEGAAHVRRSGQAVTIVTAVLFVVYLGLTRLAWWTYIGSDVWDPH